MKISIHTPQVGRDSRGIAHFERATISIHTPQVGRDFTWIRLTQNPQSFQSTRPRWGATPAASGLDAIRICDFNPHAPGGARPMYQKHLWLKFQFQSTRPRWGATSRGAIIAKDFWISIHTPQVGRDSKQSQKLSAKNISTDKFVKLSP